MRTFKSILQDWRRESQRKAVWTTLLDHLNNLIEMSVTSKSELFDHEGNLVSVDFMREIKYELEKNIETCTGNLKQMAVIDVEEGKDAVQNEEQKREKSLEKSNQKDKVVRRRVIKPGS